MDILRIRLLDCRVVLSQNEVAKVAGIASERKTEPCGLEVRLFLGCQRLIVKQSSDVQHMCASR